MVNLVVPLLTIVPIPYIAIDTIDINFKANISAQSSSVQEDSSSTDMGGEVSGQVKFGWGPFSISTDFKANYSSKKDSKATQESKYSVEYTMDIAVHAGQDSMPAGLASVLNILRESIATGSVGGKIEASPSAGKLDPNVTDQTQSLTITALDSKGLAIKTGPITIAVDAASGLKLTAPTSGTEAAQGSTEQNRIVTPGDNGNVVLGVVVADATKFAKATTVNVTVSAQIEGADKKIPVAIAVSAKA
jgi:hypothetical protein